MENTNVLLALLGSQSCILGWFGSFASELIQYYVAARKDKPPKWIKSKIAWITSLLLILVGGPITFYLVQVKPSFAICPYPIIVGFVWPTVLTVMGKALIKLQEIQKIKVIIGEQNV